MKEFLLIFDTSTDDLVGIVSNEGGCEEYSDTVPCGYCINCSEKTVKMQKGLDSVRLKGYTVPWYYDDVKGRVNIRGGGM